MKRMDYDSERLRSLKEAERTMTKYFVHLFEKENCTENFRFFEEGLEIILESNIQEYHPVSPEEAKAKARNLINSWKAGKLSRDNLLKILKKEKKFF